MHLNIFSTLIQIKASVFYIGVWGRARIWEFKLRNPSHCLIIDMETNHHQLCERDNNSKYCGFFLLVHWCSVFLWWICRGNAICFYKLSIISQWNCMSTCERRMASDPGSADCLRNLCATRMFAILTLIITSN